MDFVLEKLRSIQVNIIGEAANPGLHRVPATANVAQVISLSGGGSAAAAVYARSSGEETGNC